VSSLSLLTTAVYFTLNLSMFAAAVVLPLSAWGNRELSLSLLSAYVEETKLLHNCILSKLWRQCACA